MNPSSPSPTVRSLYHSCQVCDNRADYEIIPPDLGVAKSYCATHLPPDIIELVQRMFRPEPEAPGNVQAP
jgi:hypothetical protein